MSQSCKSCGSTNRAGELLCHECGDLLLLPGASNTAKLKLVNYVADTGLEVPHQIKVSVGDLSREISVRDGSTILIGRGISAVRDEEVLDLAELKAVEQGVSREHAAIYIEAASVFLTDLESTNGTYLNGRLLRPNQPNILRDGDIVCFGRLEAHICLS